MLIANSDPNEREGSMFKALTLSSPDDYPLHSLVSKGNAQDVEQYVARLNDRGESILLNALHQDKDDTGWPIYCALAKTFPPNYKIAIILFEAGTMPHKLSLGLSLFHYAIRKLNLPLFRLLMFFEPNYKEGLGLDAHAPDCLCTIEQRIEFWSADYPRNNIKAIIEETAIDAAKAKTLLEEAHNNEQLENFILAAFKYTEAADIYSKQSKYEIEHYHGEPAIAEYYQSKATEFYNKAKAMRQNYVENPLLLPDSPRVFESGARSQSGQKCVESDLS
ncbi:MAG: hypothetical protein Q7V63_04965 [Gammaproteobacteria bacterium]|nr:hypothetical protein [Gammaproteobacteria bacterium]